MKEAVEFRDGPGGTAGHLSDTAWESFPFWRLTYIAEGSGWYDCTGVSVRAKEGDYFLLRPGRRRVRISAPLRQIYIMFRRRADGSMEQPRTPNPIRRYEGIGHDRHMLENAFLDVRRELAKDGSLRRAAAQIEVILCLFADSVAQCGGRTSPVHEKMREVALRLVSHPEERLSVPEMADMAGLSASQFTRLFCAAYELSPGQYAIRARLEAAARLLTEEGLSVKEAAFSLNYPSPFLLSRQFKRKYGCAPSVYATSR